MELLRKGRKAKEVQHLAVIFPAGAFTVVPRKMRLRDCEQRFLGAKLGGRSMWKRRAKWCEFSVRQNFHTFGTF